MGLKNYKLLFLLFIPLWLPPVWAAKDNIVIYPDWFKNSFYDLQTDLEDARSTGKKGIMIFFSMKTCSYCQAMVETTFREKDIIQRLRKDYDVIGLDVFSDIELTDVHGKTHWTKEFSVDQKATFTPTMIFYGEGGATLLRMVGFQNAKKMRLALDYLEGGLYTRITLREYMAQSQKAVAAAGAPSPTVDFAKLKNTKKHTMVVFESADCAKCQLLRDMLKDKMMQSYLAQLNVIYINSSDAQNKLTTFKGKNISAMQWAEQLQLLHRPAIVFFDSKGEEVVRVDTDILISRHGEEVQADNQYVLSSLQARLRFVVDKGYITLPQFQRWRAQANKMR